MIAVMFQNLFVLPSDTSGFDYLGEELYCESILMVDAETGETIYSQNSDSVLSIASITKIMTFIVAVENIPDIENTYITFSSEVTQILSGTGCWTASIKSGEQFTVLDYLKMLLVTSAGDAGVQLALYYDELNGYSSDFSGYIDGSDSRAFIMEDSLFVDLMNEKAQELGCVNTNFTNPTGLYHEDNYSTAEDVAIFTEYAFSLPYFSDIVCLSEFELPATNLSSARTITTSNALLSSSLYDGMYTYEYATGIKTGRLTDAGNCLVSSASKDGREYIVVCLGAEISSTKNDSAGDAIKLYEWVFNEFSEATLIEEGDFVTNIDLENNYTTTEIEVTAGETAVSYLPNDFNVASISIQIEIYEDISAPISANDVVGVASFVYNDYVFGTVELVSSEDVSKVSNINIFQFDVDVPINYELVSILSILTILLIVIVVLLVFINIRGRKRKRRKRRKI